MRYPKHSIQLNPSRDLPLLRQILHSEFVTHSQLFDFMRLNYYESSRKSFDWRVRRLVQRLLVRRHTPLACAGEFVYSVAGDAAMLLQGIGECCLVGNAGYKEREAERNVSHAIGLNEIQLSLLRRGLLARWVGAIEIRSQNELTGFGFAKDYDAVVTIHTEMGEQRFALEYERSPKPARYYKEVVAALDREVQVSRVLYLVSNYDLLQFILGFFRDSRCRVFLGVAADWHAHLVDLSVSCGSITRVLRFREALQESFATHNDARPISG